MRARVMLVAAVEDVLSRLSSGVRPDVLADNLKKMSGEVSSVVLSTGWGGYVHERA